jgi:hypothetical protein
MRLMKRLQKITAIIAQMALVASFGLTGATAKTNGGRDLIKIGDLKEWLTYLSSDDLEGRNTFHEGLGIAAAYIAFQLKSWGVKPGGPNGSYFQRVPVVGVKGVNNSTVTVESGGQTRTFKNGEGISLPLFVGGKRKLTGDQIEFVGYGLRLPSANHDDYAGRDVKGKVVVFLGTSVPQSLGQQSRRLLGGRSRYATDVGGAVATISTGFGGRAANRPSAGAQTTDAQSDSPDFTTVERLDAPAPPSVSASDEFLELLFSGADVKYAELKEKAARGEPLPTFSLKNATITFNIDADYRVVRTQYTRNVIGIIEGADSKLKDTYVAFGAHYDHVGYAEGELTQSASGPRRAGARGRVTEGAVDDRVWNGADDDGSGTVTIMAIAKAFALGPKPRRSLIFVWHSGEERGLWGSRYFADYPTVPLDKIVAHVNMDMVGRNFQDRPEAASSLFVVGSDRISTEFHNITIDANAALPNPLKLDFAMNDVTDPEQIYYRSDHYSYAAKGIPAVFLFSGLHKDYHANTDHIEKINWDKMERVGKLAYEIGARVGNLDRPPARDNRGPRVGKGSEGKLKP